MGSILQCLFCKCCDDDEEQQQQQDDDDETEEQRRPLGVARMSRGGDHDESAGGSYQVAPVGSADDDQDAVDDRNNDNDDDDDDGSCCLPDADNVHSAGVREFFHRLRARWRMHDPVAVMDDGETSPIDPRNPFGITKHPPSSSKAINSPLRTANSFDSSSGIPTIGAEEVVLPGSHLQKEMARAMSQNLESQDDECVICMEGFDPTNPRMPTHCGCGQNKTYFHLPCLYQWIEQSRECPSCRQKLRWEEF